MPSAEVSASAPASTSTSTSAVQAPLPSVTKSVNASAPPPLKEMGANAFQNALAKLRQQPFAFTVQSFGKSATEGFRATGKTDGAKWFVTEKTTDGKSEFEYLLAANVTMEREVNPNARFRQSRDGSMALAAVQRLIATLPNDLATSKVGATESVTGTLATAHTYGSPAGEVTFWFDERGETIVKIQLFPADQSVRSMAAEFTEFQKPQVVPLIPNLRRW